MKTKILFRFLFTAACLSLALSSCVKDEEDVFEKSASVRMQEALVQAKEVLTSPEKGWIMYYFPEGDQIYGGYVYTLRFSQEGEVTARCELFDEAYTSLYSLKKDDGPVLSFDTNNHAFHYFATPSGGSSMPNLYGETGRYQAYKGDFEFMILKAEKEQVILKGKRTGNKIIMVPLAEDPESYFAKVADINDNLFVSSFEGKIGSDDLTIDLDIVSRQATFTLPGESYKDEDGEPASEKMAYAITDEGIRFYKPVKIGPYTVETFVFDTTNQQLIDSSNNAQLQGSLPEGWHAYGDFLGTYRLVYNNGSDQIEGVQIVEKVAGKSYVVKGLSDAFDVQATYELSSGRFHIQAQYVATLAETGTDFQIMMAGHDSSAGSVNYTTSGMLGTLNEAGNTISWSHNNLWSGKKTDGFILYKFSAAGSRIDTTAPPAPWQWKGRESLSTSHRLSVWVAMERM